jgi:predicted 3-demethylubiquinone-9 3-methyltransferase (glyoxalase superfamily)
MRYPNGRWPQLEDGAADTGAVASTLMPRSTGRDLSSLPSYCVDMPPVTPCLWFDGTAGAAADHYIAIFPNSKRLSGDDDGSAIMVTFELDGKPFMALNGGPNYQITPAISFVVNCDTQAEVDHYWDGLIDGGEAMQCGWLTDRFGVSWQIVPNRLGELMSDPDPERSGRVMQAMLKMIKLDIAGLEAAAAGE